MFQAWCEQKNAKQGGEEQKEGGWPQGNGEPLDQSHEMYVKQLELDPTQSTTVKVHVSILTI